MAHVHIHLSNLSLNSTCHIIVGKMVQYGTSVDKAKKTLTAL